MSSFPTSLKQIILNNYLQQIDAEMSEPNTSSISDAPIQPLPLFDLDIIADLLEKAFSITEHSTGRCSIEGVRTYLINAHAFQDVSNARKSDFRPQDLDKVKAIIYKAMHKSSLFNCRKNISEDLIKQGLSLTPKGETFLEGEAAKIAAFSQAHFTQYFNEGQLSIKEINLKAVKKEKKLPPIFFNPAHVRENKTCSKKLQGPLNILFSSKPSKGKRALEKRQEHKMGQCTKVKETSALLRRARRCSLIERSLEQELEKYQNHHKQFALICKIAKNNKKDVALISADEILQYKKEMADKAFESLCLQETLKKPKKNKSKKKKTPGKARKPFLPLQNTTNFSLRNIGISEAKSAIQKAVIQRPEIFAIHTRVSNWFTVGESLHLIKLFPDVRYRYMTDDQLIEQRDCHNLRGMELVFFNVFDRETYGCYIGLVNGHPSWNFHAKKTVSRNGQKEISSGFISIGLGNNNSGKGPEKLIMHMKFDEIQGEITCGKDLLKIQNSTISEEETSTWTTVVTKKDTYKKQGSTILLEYPDTGVKFEIDPLT